MRHRFTWVAMAYAAILAVMLSMCACMGCATPDHFEASSIRYSPAVKAIHSDESTWRHYSSYKDDCCEICGRTRNLIRKMEWAHEKPQTDYPALKNDPDNGHTLCRTCHSFAHYNNFSVYWVEDMDALVEFMKTHQRKYKKYD